MYAFVVLSVCGFVSKSETCWKNLQIDVKNNSFNISYSVECSFQVYIATIHGTLICAGHQHRLIQLFGSGVLSVTGSILRVSMTSNSTDCELLRQPLESYFFIFLRGNKVACKYKYSIELNLSQLMKCDILL